MKFVGRAKELSELNKIYESEKAELVIVYGRRRMGKTTLIKKSLPKKSIYMLLTQEKPIQNLNSFKELLKKTDNLLGEVSANTWEEYFRKISKNLPEKLVIALDEFPYLVSQDKTILSQFQKIYDEYLKPKKIKLILCGSSLSIMKDLQKYESPLYGRRTFSINLKPFSLKESFSFLKLPTHTKLKAHLLTGGIPYYLEQFQDAKSEDEFFDTLLSTRGIFYDEPFFLLREDFRETSNYFSILKAVARGKNTFSEISTACFIEKGSLSKYLQMLEKLEYLENVRSFFSKQNSKKTIYTISDNFLFFWFKVISRKNNNLNYDLNSTLGKLFEKEVKKIFSKHYEEVGTYFSKGVEIDLLAKNKKDIVCVECKYSLNTSNKDLVKLKEKIKFLPEKFNYDAKIISLKDINSLVKMS